MEDMFSHLYLSEAYIPVEQDISEDVNAKTGVKKLKLKGVYSVAESVNRNKRWYSAGLLQRETNRLQEIINEQGGLISELNHPVVDPNDPRTLQRALKTDMERGAMLIKKVSFDGKRMYGEGEIVEATIPGRVVAGMARAGLQIPVSTRGAGPQSNQMTAEGAIVVPDKYKMITIDVVTGQSCQESVMETIEESYNMLYESMHNMGKNFKEHPDMKTNMWTVAINFMEKM